MTNSEYQQLVEFLGVRFVAIDRRFDALEQRFDVLDQRVDAGFREVFGHFDEIYRRLKPCSLTSRTSARLWSEGWTS